MIADRVRALRRLAGISSSELDLLAGLSRSYARQIEGATKSNPTIQTLRSIATVFGCSLGYLGDGEGRAPPKEAVLKAIARARKRQAAREKKQEQK